MKLVRIIATAAALSALVGCASSGPASSPAPLVPMTDAVGTTTITSALEPTDEEGAPVVTGQSRSLSESKQNALDTKRTASREGKRQRAFVDYK